MIMRYYSTHNPQHTASLEEAVVRGLAPDGGLYMPVTIPTFSADYFDTLPQRTFQQIGFDVAHQLLGDDVPADVLRNMINHTITFDAPLVEVEPNVFALELFHGPTLAFKDFGARFMSQLLGYFAYKAQQKVTILVATSGDTGSAVANGFLGVPNTNVVVLYPSGKVSEVQEKQFTTLGKNITALEVTGTFDDCQRLVKQAFNDEDLRQKLFLTSANSINIARLIPQSFYYFYAWSRLPNRENVVVSVPSGNFGNLTAGLFAKRMGLPIKHFIASTNANDVVPHYLQSKQFTPRPSVATISNAMDVGNPSNFARMLALYQHDAAALQRDITGFAFSDTETHEQMKATYAAQGYLLDPHGAVGLLGLKQFLAHNPSKTGCFLETAHPAKFNDVVDKAVNFATPMPPALEQFMKGKKVSLAMSADFASFKKLLLAKAD